MATSMRPGTIEQLGEMVRTCAAAGQTMTPVGGRTKMGWGYEIAVEAAIEMTALAGVREHSWQDLTATVAAGTTWAAMQAELARHGQRVALDPLFAERATVGGVLATNDAGLLRMRYGGLRDLVLGMTIVLADGTVARTGGKVVKNVAGYDLPKLLTGSFGTLGIIAEATFRLHPVQRQTAAFTVRSVEIAPLAELMTAVLTAGMSVEAMALRNEATAFALELMFAAVPEALLEHEQRLRGLAKGLAVKTAQQEMFAMREALFGMAGATVIKLTTLPNKLAALVAGFAQLDQMPETTARVVADPTGVVTAAVVAPAGALATMVADLRARLRGVGGTVVVLRRGALSVEVDPWNEAGDLPPAIDVMRAIKQEFDPARLLSPGRFVGGL